MTNNKKTIGFIGAGNMGEAIIGALINSNVADPAKIIASDINNERLESLKETYGINITHDNLELYSICDIIILSVKPQHMDEILSQITLREDFSRPSKHRLIISIAAGITTKKIETILYNTLDDKKYEEKLPIIRVMPNTPALVLAGMSGMSPNRHASDDDIRVTKTILEAMGSVVELGEEHMDAVTALSGSGPAYIFYLAESMIDAGIKIGLDPDKAVTLTMKTMKGAIKLMEETEDSPETLRKKVASPGGTTEAAFKVLEKNSVKENFIEAIGAAAARSKELSG